MYNVFLGYPKEETYSNVGWGNGASPKIITLPRCSVVDGGICVTEITIMAPQTPMLSGGQRGHKISFKFLKLLYLFEFETKFESFTNQQDLCGSKFIDSMLERNARSQSYWSSLFSY